MSLYLTRLFRAFLLDSREQYAAAIQRLGQHPDNGIARNNRGVLHWEIGNADAALADFAVAIEKLPNEPDPRMNRGNLLEKLGRTEEALADYAAALELAPEDAYHRRTRAGLLHRLGRFEEAIADYDIAIGLAPGFQHTIDARARAAARQPPAS